MVGVIKGPVIWATFSCILSGSNVVLQVEIVCCACINFHVAKSRRRFYLSQHEILLRTEAVMRATNNFNLQHNIVARYVARKCCPHSIIEKVFDLCF